MKKCKATALLGILFLVIPFSIAAYEDDEGFVNDTLLTKPTLTPSLTGYFTQAMSWVHTGMLASNGPCVFFHDLNFGVDGENDLYDFNIFLGGMIPVSRYFAIPLFCEVISGDTLSFDHYDKEKTQFERSNTGIMLGGGLAVHGDWGVLGAYAGYGWHSGKERGQGFRTADFQYGYENDWQDNKLRWAVFPVINAKEYPLLKNFVKLIDGFFAMDNFDDEFRPTYKANVVFKNIGGVTLGTYAKKDYYDFDAKYNLYAGKIDLSKGRSDSALSIILPTKTSIELGYREFFDVTNPSKTYENGIYANISLKWFVDSGFGFMVYCESGPTNFLKNPTIGFLINAVSLARIHLSFGQKTNMGLSGGLFFDRDY